MRGVNGQKQSLTQDLNFVPSKIVGLHPMLAIANLLAQLQYGALGMVQRVLRFTTIALMVRTAHTPSHSHTIAIKSKVKLKDRAQALGVNVDSSSSITSNTLDHLVGEIMDLSKGLNKSRPKPKFSIEVSFLILL